MTGEPFSSFPESIGPDFLTDIVATTPVQPNICYFQNTWGLSGNTEKWEDIAHYCNPPPSPLLEFPGLSALYLAYWKRIVELYNYAVLEGFSLSPASSSDFCSFMESAFFTRKAGLVLLENGNLRAVWKDDQGNRLALHFLGDHTVQYVIFTHPASSPAVSRVAGTASLDEVKALVTRHDLAALVKA